MVEGLGDTFLRFSKLVKNGSRVRDYTCLVCLGSGKIHQSPTSFGAWKITCPTCYGKGKVEKGGF